MHRLLTSSCRLPTRLLLLPKGSPYHTNGTLVKQGDPFATLKLSWGATQTEIKEAYRSLAKR